jgi:hypothetical protein
METETQEPPEDSGEGGFSSLVLMLGTMALTHLGAAPDPGGGQTKVDLAQARCLLDLLEVLKEKTAGNLTSGESTMLEALLFDLRMHYVEAVKRA